MRLPRPRLWWPRSLVGRVFALYSTALLVFVFGALALFYQHQFDVELEKAQLRADALVEVLTPIVADNAIIGDYDTIRRVLERALRHSDFASCAFIDVKGAVVKAARQDQPTLRPPPWIRSLIADRLYDTNQPIHVGGKDYGVLRLSFAADRVAGEMWRQTRMALLLGIGTVVGGLLLIGLPMRRWLGTLERLQSFDGGIAAGGDGVSEAMAGDAPIEFQRTFFVLNRAAASIQAQREQADVTLAAIADAVLTLDAGGRVVFANPAAGRVFGVDARALQQRPVQQLLPGLFDSDASLHEWRGRRVRIVAADGAQRVLETTLSPVTGPDAPIAGYVMACRDVSERHALEKRLKVELRQREAAMSAMRGVLEAGLPDASAGEQDDIQALSRMVAGLVAQLQERGAQLDAIFALSPDGFVSFDAARRINYVSPAFTRLTGLEPDDVLGQDEHRFQDLLGSRCAGAAPMPSFDELRRAAAASADASRRRNLLEMAPPTPCVLEAALQSGDGSSVSQVLHLRDVTHETEVDQMKSEFLSTAAHELRTPMASIYGYTELMMTRPLPPERQRMVIETVHRQTGMMIAIVNELLDLARIEARRGKDFQIERLDVGELVQEMVQDFKPPQERAAPRVRLPFGLLRVRADRSKLLQALNNVLSNAYKYSPDGGAVWVDLDEAGDKVGVRIRDQGIGMAPHELARVCERFYRADTSGRIPGTGLGMSIVKEIAELHGGKLDIQSRPGEGTSVTLWLPLAGQAATAPMPLDEPRAAAHI
jgi:PAS domain S-box-containing protein